MGSLIEFLREQWETRQREIDERGMGENERKVREILAQPDPTPTPSRYDFGSDSPYRLPEYRDTRRPSQIAIENQRAIREHGYRGDVFADTARNNHN